MLADIYLNNGIIYLTQNINTNGQSLTYTSPVRLRPNGGPGTITIDTSTGSSAPFGAVAFTKLSMMTMLGRPPAGSIP